MPALLHLTGPLKSIRHRFFIAAFRAYKPDMFRCLLILLTALTARAELRVPGCTAYGAPNFDAIRLHKERGVTNWTDAKQSVLWFGEIKNAGKLDVSVAVRLPESNDGLPQLKLKLTLAGKS